MITTMTGPGARGCCADTLRVYQQRVREVVRHLMVDDPGSEGMRGWNRALEELLRELELED